MHILSYIENDSINPPSPRTCQETVLALSVPGTSVISKENLLTNYSTVFSEGVGKLEGEYHIRLDMKIEPVQQAPRRVPVALREPLKRTLDILVEQDILAPVTKPKAWISSIVVVPKSNGLLHICLDPKDLNKAILREHYPLPTIEDVATRSYGAKLFSILDVRNGFWHVVQQISVETNSIRNQLGIVDFPKKNTWANWRAVGSRSCRGWFHSCWLWGHQRWCVSQPWQPLEGFLTVVWGEDSKVKCRENAVEETISTIHWSSSIRRGIPCRPNQSPCHRWYAPTPGYHSCVTSSWTCAVS